LLYILLVFCIQGNHRSVGASKLTILTMFVITMIVWNSQETEARIAYKKPLHDHYSLFRETNVLSKRNFRRQTTTTTTTTTTPKPLLFPSRELGDDDHDHDDDENVDYDTYDERIQLPSEIAERFIKKTNHLQEEESAFKESKECKKSEESKESKQSQEVVTKENAHHKANHHIKHSDHNDVAAVHNDDDKEKSVIMNIPLATSATIKTANTTSSDMTTLETSTISTSLSTVKPEEESTTNGGSVTAVARDPIQYRQHRKIANPLQIIYLVLAVFSYHHKYNEARQTRILMVNPL